MSLGVSVIARSTPPARGAPTDTGTWFVVGEAASGPTDQATLVRSITSYEQVYGQRSGGGQKLYDAADTFFQEGGSRLYVGNHGAAGTPDDGLELFTKNHGPGQVSAPGEVDAATIGALYTHANAHNRYAICDTADIVDTTPSAPPAGVPVGKESWGAIFAPICEAPGPVGVSGVTSRDVPASSVIAALCNRVDLTGNPNQAAAGRDYPLQYVTNFKQEFSDPDRESLLDMGVNTFADVYGVLENYGFQTTLTQEDDPVYWQANCGRMRMRLVAESMRIGENFMFKPIDGRGILASSLAMALSGMLATFYGLNALYGETAKDAYRVIVDDTVEYARDDLPWRTAGRRRGDALAAREGGHRGTRVNPRRGLSVGGELTCQNQPSITVRTRAGSRCNSVVTTTACRDCGPRPRAVTWRPIPRRPVPVVWASRSQSVARPRART